MKRRVAVLGSTGSIGRQALDVISRHSELFEVALLTANNSAEALARQARESAAPDVVICNPDRYAETAALLEGSATKVHAGMDAVCELVAKEDIDIVLTAMMGFSGLKPTVAAIRAGKTIALANKETLVAAGSVVTSLAAEYGVRILPVDSEHSAIFQCLQGAAGNRIRRIHLTASGGPFRTWTREQIAAAGPQQALKHPNWSMGRKITIDSATMMNKGLEVIEAKWLFDVEPDRINVVVQPESLIHSMVEFEDGAVIAQLGSPDMREPIQYALSYPERLDLDNRKVDFAEIGSISFGVPDLQRFPALGLAFEAIRKGGNMPCIMNAANEQAVAAYLDGKISFYGISDIVAETMAGVKFAAEPDLDDIYYSNSCAGEYAQQLINSSTRRW